MEEYIYFLDGLQPLYAWDPTLLIAGIMATASLVGTIWNNKKTNAANKEINDQNADLQRELQANEQEYNTQMWEKTNEYNSPANEVQRMKDAGLNPMNWSGATPATTVTSSGASAPSSIPMQSMNFMDMLGAMSGVANLKNASTAAKQQQVDARMADTKIENMVAQSAMYKAQVENFQSMVDSRDFFENPLKQSTIDYTKKQILNMDVQLENVRANTNYIKEQTNGQLFLNKKYKNEVDNQLRMFDVQYKLALADLGIKGQELEMLGHQAHILMNDSVLSDNEVDISKLLMPWERLAIPKEGANRVAAAVKQGNDLNFDDNDVLRFFGRVTGIVGNVFGAANHAASTYSNFQQGNLLYRRSQSILNPFLRR